MTIARISLALFAALLAAATSAAAQVPADLRAAMLARDSLLCRGFGAVGKVHRPNVHYVQQDGSFLTRVERLVNLRSQTPRPYVTRSREQNERRGDVAVARFFSGGLWVLEVWTRETGTWMVLMSQVTTARPVR